VKSLCPYVKEGDKEKQLQWIGDMVCYLRRRNIQTADRRNGKAQDGRASQQGIDPDNEPGGDTPGQLLRRGTLPEQRQDRQDRLSIKPAVTRNCLRRVDFSEAGILWMHVTQDRLPSGRLLVGGRIG